MKRALITTLRNRHASLEEFRQAADQLATILAVECDVLFPKAPTFVETPLAKTHGVVLKHPPILIPILRSGLVLLHPFLQFYPNARVGFIGARRDEETAEAEIYYTKLPFFTAENPILVLEPMIATGGSALHAVEVLIEAGAQEKQIAFISYIAAPEGITRLQQRFPEVTLRIAQVDEGLNSEKWIIPGLGDFGDRYFGN